MEINKEVVKRELRRKLEREINGSRWLEATNGLISIRKRNLHKKYPDFTLSEIEGLICERLAQEYEAAKANPVMQKFLVSKRGKYNLPF